MSWPVALAILLARGKSTDPLLDCHLKAKESWSYVLQGPTDELDTGLVSRRCCWLCAIDGEKQAREKGSVGGPSPVLSACGDLHPGGRREPSPQSSRVFLSNPPV